MITKTAIKEAVVRKVLMKRINSRGVIYALVSDGNSFEVWKLCENYCGSATDGIAGTWRYVEKGMPEGHARQLFDRRTM